MEGGKSVNHAVKVNQKQIDLLTRETFTNVSGVINSQENIVSRLDLGGKMVSQYDD